MSSLVLHTHPVSGHCHRVQLLLALLGVPATLRVVDLPRGEQRSPEFLAKNPFGQVPVLEDGDVVVADSNAILVYLAGRFDPEGRWLPREPARAAEVQRWLSLAAGPLASGPAAARVAAVFGRDVDVTGARDTARTLFARMDRHLGERAFLAGDRPTIADVAMYAYTAHAPEGGVSLAPYPAVRAWLGRVEALPGFVPMQRTRTKELAEATA